jgi:titin
LSLGLWHRWLVRARRRRGHLPQILRRAVSFRPALETLERRQLPSIFTVVNTNDAGPGSLRQALLDANGQPGTNTIAFDIAGDGVQTIRPTTALPPITNPVILDGTTQPGYAGAPLIELDGSAAGHGINALRVQAGDSTIRAMVIDQFDGTALVLQGGGGDVVQGCYLGTDPSGTLARSNGLGIDVTSPANTIGSTDPGAGNLISGNRVDGMRLEAPGASGNVVLGNLIGTDITGTQSLAVPGSNNGVVVAGSDNTIGGTDPGAGNIISGNVQQGIFLNGAGAVGNQVLGNFIGTDAAGAAEVPNGLRGITVANGASGNTIGGDVPGSGNLLSGNMQNGIEFTGAGTSDNVAQGNLIGTDLTGTTALPNHLRGVGISYGATHNTVGGTTAAARNVISGNMQNGVLLDADTDANLVEANFIGTDVTGTQAIPNLFEGVLLGKTSVAGPITHNTVGGTDPGAGNLISGNRMPGVRIKDDQTSANVVQGNLIGTDVTGTLPLPNGNQGVLILQAANGNTVGGTDPGAGNVISGNAQDGVEIKDNGTTGNLIQGNWIGTDPAGTAPLGNAGDGVHVLNASGNYIGGTQPGAGNVIAYNGHDGVRIEAGAGNAINGNAIFGHDNGLGIELGSGGNQNQAFPDLTSAVSDGRATTLTGTLTSTPDTTFTVEIFVNAVCHPSGYGEGEQFLAHCTVTTDDNGNASFTFTLAVPVDPGQFITATATDPDGNSSAFSACVTVTGPAPYTRSRR